MTLEIFNDPNHFDTWCVRSTEDKRFVMAIHLTKWEDAEHAKRVIEEWVKQGQREVLLEAANKLNYGDIAYTELRKMAEELK